MGKFKDTFGEEAPPFAQEGLKREIDRTQGFSGLPLDKISTAAKSLPNAAIPTPENPSSGNRQPGATTPADFVIEGIDFDATRKLARSLASVVACRLCGAGLEDGPNLCHVDARSAEGLICLQFARDPHAKVTPWERATPEWNSLARAERVAGALGGAVYIYADQAFRRMWPADARGMTDLHRRTRLWLDAFDGARAAGDDSNEARLSADLHFLQLTNSTDPLQKDKNTMGEQTQIPGANLPETDVDVTIETENGADESAPPKKKRGRPPGSGAKPPGAPAAPRASSPSIPAPTDAEKAVRAIRKRAQEIAALLEPVAPWNRRELLLLVGAMLRTADAERETLNRLSGRERHYPHRPNDTAAQASFSEMKAFVDAMAEELRDALERIEQAAGRA